MEASQVIHDLFEHMKSFGIEPTDEEVGKFLPSLKYKSFKKGEIFLEIGQVCNEAYYSIKGFCRSFYRLPNGNEKTYLIYAENSIFTDHASFIGQKPATECLEAIEEMEVMYIEYQDLMLLYKKYHVIESFGRRISDVNFMFSQKRLRSMMNDDAPTRYLKFMKHYKNLSKRIPQHIIASYLGITPQSFSRIKRELET